MGDREFLFRFEALRTKGIAIADPEIIGLHISPKGRGGEKPVPGSLYAWAAEKFGA